MKQRFTFFGLLASAALCVACSTQKTSGELPVLRTPGDDAPTVQQPAQSEAAQSEPGAADGAAGVAAEVPVESPETADDHGHVEEALSEASSEPTDSCCAAHDAPGCADEVIEACVCAADVLPQCCTDGWSPACVEVVRQRHCDPGVRECVCTEWEQTSCCESEWTNTFCDTAAELKCGASIGCHL